MVSMKKNLDARAKLRWKLFLNTQPCKGLLRTDVPQPHKFKTHTTPMKTANAKISKLGSKTEVIIQVLVDIAVAHVSLLMFRLDAALAVDRNVRTEVGQANLKNVSMEAICT